MTDEDAYPVQHDDAAWRQRLTPEQYRVLRRQGTEPAGSSPLNAEKREGMFLCAGCDATLFRSKDKFESGTGWPSFTRPADRRQVTELADRSHGMLRTEVRCASCGGHLGHVFDDGPGGDGQRYCMNGLALHFKPDAR